MILLSLAARHPILQYFGDLYARWNRRCFASGRFYQRRWCRCSGCVRVDLEPLSSLSSSRAWFTWRAWIDLLEPSLVTERHFGKQAFDKNLERWCMCSCSLLTVTFGSELVLPCSDALFAWYIDEQSFDRIRTIHRRWNASLSAYFAHSRYINVGVVRRFPHIHNPTETSKSGAS